MDSLKKIFPLSFSFAPKDTMALITAILIHIVADFVCGLIIGLLGKIPLIGFIFSLVGWVVGIYFLAGLILSALNYSDAIK